MIEDEERSFQSSPSASDDDGLDFSNDKEFGDATNDFPGLESVQLGFHSKLYRKLVDNAEQLLCADNLLQTAVSTCCKKDCILNLSPLRKTGNMSAGVEVIRGARLPIVRLSNEQQYDVLKAKLEEMTTGVRNFKYSVMVNNERRVVCHKAFELIYGMSRYWRKELTRDVNGASDVKRFRVKRTKASSETRDRILRMFNSDNLVGFDTNHVLSMGVISSTQGTQTAYNFMKAHFELMGCKEPNAPVGELHIQGADKREIYDEYLSDIVEGCQVLSYCSFTKLWTEAFPYVRLHEYKVVSGKCDVCAQLAAARSSRKDEVGRQKLEDLRMLHRTMYMGEKNLYYKRAQEAASGRGDSMSLNTDGMTQSNCEIPYMSNLAEFSTTLKQHIQGVLEHGREFVVYRSFNNVRHGANLAIHCLLLQLENRMQAFNGRLPSTLYIQIDGGGENANYVTLGLCAMLVARRVGGLRKVILTRLPKGHTHEDCDSQFGVIWRAMRQRNILTPDDYKALVLQALNHKGKMLPTRVVDLFVVPDYTAAIKPGMDDRLSNIYKKLETQLQFKFEAVPRCRDYPLGVKTQYRAYAADEVCEIIKCTPTSALDVGFAAHLVKVQWFPVVRGDNTPQVQAGQPVHPKEPSEKPLNVLKDLPTDCILAAGFLEGSKEKLDRTVRAVHKYFRDKMAVNAGWDKFEGECPQNDSASDYIRKNPLHVPLMSELFGNIGIDGIVDVPAVKPRLRKLQDLPIAHSTASVRHSGNHGLVVPPPRVYDDDGAAPNADGPVVAPIDYHKQTILSMTVKQCKLAVLKELVNEINQNVVDKRRRLNVSGNKQDLLTRLQAHYGQAEPAAVVHNAVSAICD